MDKLVLWAEACAQFILYLSSNKLYPRYYKNDNWHAVRAIHVDA